MELNTLIGKTIFGVSVVKNPIPGMDGSIHNKNDGSLLVYGTTIVLFTDGTVIEIDGEYDEGVLFNRL